MKTVVFAYHDMGCLGIEALLAAGYEISAIFTHSDNPCEKAFMVRLPDLQRKEAFRFTRRITLIIHYGWSALPKCRRR